MDNQNPMELALKEVPESWTNNLLPVYMASLAADITGWDYEPQETPLGIGIHLVNLAWGASALALPSETSVWSIDIWLTEDEDDIDSAPLVLAAAELGQPYRRVTMGSGFALQKTSRKDAGYAVLSAIREAIYGARNDAQRTDIYARIPRLSIDSMGGMVPFQAFGQWDNYDFYFRYRHGYAQLNLGHMDDEDNNLVTSGTLWDAGEAYGDEYDGCLTLAEFISLFCSLFAKLEPSPFRYEFDTVDGTGYPKGVWAYSVEEAQDLLAKHVTDREKYQSHPKNLDDRVYPSVSPDFLVLPDPKAG
jgi:hypothetical protein